MTVQSPEKIPEKSPEKMLAPKKPLPRRIASVVAAALLLVTAVTACGGSDADEPIIYSGTGEAVPSGD